MPLASKSVNGDGSNTSFSFAFDYLDTSHISVLVDGVSTSFTFTSTYILSVTPAPGAGLDVTIQRTTPNDAPLVDFSGGSVLLESDLDTATVQSLFVAQETLDTISASMGRTGANWDAESLQIKNLAEGTTSTDAVSKSQLDAAIIAAGNVPSPDNPGDDGKVLEASAGTWSWVTRAMPVSGLSDATTFMKTLLTTGSASAARAALVAATTGANTFSGTQSFADNILERPKIKDYSETQASAAVSSGVLSMDCETSNNFHHTLSENVTSISVSNWPASGARGSVTLEITQHASSAKTVSFAGIELGDAVTPDVSALGSVTTIVLWTRDGGTTVYGSVAFQKTS